MLYLHLPPTLQKFFLDEIFYFSCDLSVHISTGSGFKFFLLQLSLLELFFYFLKIFIANSKYHNLTF